VNVTGSLITTDAEPVTGFAPDQSPEAEQLAASVDDQLNVIVLPRLTEDGLAVRLTVGSLETGGWVTTTVTLSLALPPSPLQLIVYVVVTPGLTDSELLVAVLVVQPAVQLVASVELQLSVDDCPWSMAAGDADRFTVGTGAGGAFTVTVTLSLALPPSPLQVMAYVVVAPGLTDSEPLVAVLAVQPAVQLVASVEPQLSVVDCP